jgi:ribosome-associated protein
MAPPDDLVVSRSCVISGAELAWRFSGSGGPGGQHANTANTRVELLFDIAGSASLGPRQRERLLERLGPVVRVVVSTERSQARNREIARVRLAERLAAALRVEPPRRATRPTRASKERRLLDKRQHAERKRMRARPDGD